jgi:hypothetical protein
VTIARWSTNRTEKKPGTLSGAWNRYRQEGYQFRTQEEQRQIGRIIV